MHIRSVLFAAALFLQGCALGPDYTRPNTPATALNTYINAPETVEDNQEASMTAWWESIDDPLLNGYVDQLLKQNLALTQASERVIQTREAITGSAAAFFPSLGVDASASRSFAGNAGNAFIPSSGGRVFTTVYSPSLVSQWELDTFGRIRRGVESSKATYLANVYDREALAHSLIADLVALRVEIALNQSLLTLAEQTVQNRKKVYDFVKGQYELGSANSRPQNVLQAEGNLTTVEADINRIKRNLANATYRLDTLLGQPPGTTNPTKTDFPMLPPDMNVPLCLPADLLDRRPDIRASELRLIARNADIGVAIADLYPTLSLSGSLGFSSQQTSDLFSSQKLAGSILGSITSRLFNAGALRANVRVQESEARESAAAYAETILNALRDVETALNAEQELAQELNKTKGTRRALHKAEAIIAERYIQGVENFQVLLDAQRDLYTAEQGLLTAQSAYWNARISLYLALGGDWLGLDEAKNHPACGAMRDVSDG